MTLRLVFMGTPDFAVPTLVEIIGQGHDIVAVYSQPPRPSGRGMPERRSPVHDKALEFGLTVHTPTSLKSDDAAEIFAGHQADAAIVVAYGLLLPQAVLDAPREGCLNLHASLLPRWRGAAPIQRAIMAGDGETGAMVMRMDVGLDTGPICLAERVAIAPDETAGQLHDRLARLGADLMARGLGGLERGTLTCQPQSDEGACYAAKLSKDEARIDWSQQASHLHNKIRGLSPFPAAWTTVQIGEKSERLKILRSQLQDGHEIPSGAEPGTILDDQLTVVCGDQALQILEVQRAGKAVMSAADFLRGVQVDPGTRFE